MVVELVDPGLDAAQIRSATGVGPALAQVQVQCDDLQYVPGPPQVADMARNILQGQPPIGIALGLKHLLTDPHDRLDVGAALSQLYTKGVQIAESDADDGMRGGGVYSSTSDDRNGTRDADVLARADDGEHRPPAGCHTLARLATDGSDRMPKFVLASLAEALGDPLVATRECFSGTVVSGLVTAVASRTLFKVTLDQLACRLREGAAIEASPRDVPPAGACDPWLHGRVAATRVTTDERLVIPITDAVVRPGPAHVGQRISLRPRAVDPRQQRSGRHRAVATLLPATW
jgi:hypothetical protein